MERDDDVRASCFAALDVLRAQFGSEIPYRGGLDRGFAFRGAPRVPFLNFQKGIHRAAAQRGPAALSVQTSANSPYGDAPSELGFRYAYRAGSIDQPDNRALRAAHQARVPLVYFIATQPGRYDAVYPTFVAEDDPAAREVLVIPAYRERCAICRLHEVRLLDATHIVGDAESAGEPAVSNGLSLCSIHHRAFDRNLVGVSPDLEVRVAPRLLDEIDGPMLDLLKGFDGSRIDVPRRKEWQPSRDGLAQRFEQFASAV